MVPRSIRNLDETNQKPEEHRQIGKVLEVTSRSLPSPSSEIASCKVHFAGIAAWCPK